MKITDAAFTDHMKTIVLPMIKDTIAGTEGKVISEVVEKQVAKSLEDKSLMPSWLAHLTNGTDRGSDKKEPRKREKGDAGARIIRAACNSSLNKGGRAMVVKLLNDWGDEDLADFVVKDGERLMKAAMSVSDATAGGFLVPEQFSTDIIELLRPMSVVRDLVGNSLPMPTGTVNIPKITEGSTAYYQAENANITKSQLKTGQLKLTWRKLTALVPMSNDLLRYSSPAADAIVRRDMVRAIGQRENQAFLRGQGVDGGPEGLRWLASNAANPITANATVNLANVTSDLGRMVLDLLNDNVPITRGGWIFSPRTYMYLYTVQTTNGVFAYRDEMSRGTFWGYPYRVTTQVPINLTDHGGTAESEVYFADFDDIVIGDSMALRVDASDVASYVDGGTTVSAFSTDQTVIRCITEHDFNTRRAESISVMNGVNWGV